jgi:hypothetical protein
VLPAMPALSATFQSPDRCEQALGTILAPTCPPVTLGAEGLAPVRPELVGGCHDWGWQTGLTGVRRHFGGR